MLHALQKDRGKRGSRAKASSKMAKKTTPTPKPRPPSVATIVEEVMVGGEAIRYYVRPETSAGEDRGGAFLTQNEGMYTSITLSLYPLVCQSTESEGAPSVIANQALPLSKSTYEQCRSRYMSSVCAHTLS